MTIPMELRPKIEAELKARAEKNGLSLIQYVQRILEHHVPGQELESAMIAQESAKGFQDWTESFPNRRTTPLSDEALSREAFYQTDAE